MAEHTKKTWYRPDIDGLRALAIIPVILFHANIAGFTGGYIGVDIFFVISGFLITSIIHREIKAGQFSLISFWERRARRIIPAVFAVVSATLIAGYFIILYPIDYIDLGQSALAQAFFLANIFFIRNNGYFAGPSETMPLVHTWSLSVEEQFYIGFPILIILIWKFARRALLPILVILGVLSVLYSYYLLSVAPGDGFTIPYFPNVWSGAINTTAAFYFLPSRAFELIIGAVLAITAFSISGKRTSELVAIAGLAMVLYSIVAFSRETAFPGMYALIPTLGTAAIIASNTTHRTFVGNMLSFPVFVWIGLISYSLYLWHWPLLVFGRIYTGDSVLSTAMTGFILIGTFVLAYLTYRYVESPFRMKQLLAKKTHMLAGALLALVLLAGVGRYIEKTNGFPERSTEQALAIAAATVDFGPRRSECFVNSFNTGDEPCYIGAANTEKIDFVLWGDSHAASLLPVITDEAEKRGMSGATFISPACLPVSGTLTFPQIEKCEDVKNWARAFVVEHDVKHLVLVSRWSGYGRLLLPEEEQSETTAKLSEEEVSQLAFAKAFSAMLDELATEGVEVYVVKQVPQHIGYNARALFYNVHKNPKSMEVAGIGYEDYLESQYFVNTFFDELRARDNVTIIDPATILCADKETCVLIQDGVLLYENADHINMTGSFLLAPLFEDFFEKL